MDKTPFTDNDYEIVKRELLHEGFFRLVNYHLRHRKFNGEWSKTYTREVHERPTAAGVLLYDPRLDTVVLIEQFRAGASRPGMTPWLMEVVAGIYDEKQETPAEVAIREAHEEAGATILDLELIADYFVSPGGTNEYLHLYCGKVNAAKLGGIHGLPNENEDIRAFTLPALEAFQLVKDGKIKTAPVIIALQWLQLNHQWLKELWLKN